MRSAQSLAVSMSPNRAKGIQESILMTEEKEVQGLKISVAALATLTVILAVAAYFLYSAYASAEARLQVVVRQNDELTRSQQALQKRYDELKADMSRLAAPPQ
jgi:hypothetical protein